MNLNRLAYFSAVVDAGSFTRAAERLGMTKAVVSRQIAQLERELGVTLLIRTTRRVHPTEAGRMFHERCVSILREAEDAFGELAQAVAEPTGTLRIVAPNDYGTAMVVPVVSAYAARYPACRVELRLGDATVDLTSGEADIAIRIGWLDDSSLQARRIGSFRQLLVGSAAFVAATGGIRHPDDLAELAFVANTVLQEPLRWQFSRNDTDRRTVNVRATISVDATPAVLAAVLGGSGLSVLPDYLVADALESGRLTHVLPEWDLPSGGIYTVYPAARFRPVKVTAFAAMLAEAEKRRSPIAASPAEAHATRTSHISERAASET